MNSLALIQAGRESALFHLYGALLGLCHEIAGFYRLPQANAPRAELLLTREVLETIAIPEMAEMVELAQNPETWLAKLLAAHAALFQPPRAPHKPKGDVTQPLILAVNLDEEEAPRGTESGRAGELASEPERAGDSLSRRLERVLRDGLTANGSSAQG